MTPDNATQCDARHGNERCRKAAHQAPADPWHESANYMWQRVPAPNSAPSFAAPADEPASAWLERQCAASPQARYLRDELDQLRHAAKENETLTAEQNEVRRSRWRAEALCVRLAAFIVDQDVADRFDDLVVHWREDIDAMRERLAVLP